MDFEICLNDLRFFAYHGVLEEERKIGNEFIVNLSVRIPFDPQIDQDDLEATVSYADLYEIIKETMSVPMNLLEKVALEISKKIKYAYPEKVKSGRISIEKVHPPIPGMLGTASVTLNF